VRTDIRLPARLEALMKTRQLLVQFAENLIRRIKRAVAHRTRSKFAQRLLKQVLAHDEVSDSEALYQTALTVERDDTLAAEMAEWEAATIKDGFVSSAPSDNRTR
jgi:hypothetical protein